MNTILLIIFLIILLIPLWIFLGSSDKNETPNNTNGNLPFGERRKNPDNLSSDDNKNAPRRRRKSDFQVEKQKLPVEKDFSLPHKADDIIQENSPFFIYKKILENAELSLQNGDFETAIDFYKGVKNRITDKEIRNKIDENLDYIYNYQQILLKRKEEKEEQAQKSDQQIKLSLENLAEKISKSLTDVVPMGVEAIGKKYKELDNLKDQMQKIENSGKKIPENFKKIVRNSQKQNKEILKLQNKIKDLELGNKNEENEKLNNQNDLISDKIDKLEKYLAEQQVLNSIDNLNNTKDIVDSINDKVNTLNSNVSRNNTPAAVPVNNNVAATPSAYPFSLSENKNTGLKHTGSNYNYNPPGNNYQPEFEKTNITNEIKKQKEDKKEDFELVRDYIKEPEFKEPSEDEIYAKILEDTIESYGERKKQDEGNSWQEEDYEYEFDRRRARTEEEEEKFFSKIMDKSRTKRKELPILRVSYNFSQLPDQENISKDQNVLENSFYKYKPMLEKASEYIKQRKIQNAINYYKVVASQNIPAEFKKMISQNINDLTEYLEKYFSN